MSVRTALLAAVAATALAAPTLAQKAPAESYGPLRPDQQAFRETYKELVETDTQYPTGDCTLAAHRMGARLAAAGYPDADITYITPPDRPREGGVVAVLHGSDPKAKAILLLAHIDVVAAHREDWTRDPFKLIEENGYFYGRGSSDDKAMASVNVDTLIRFRKEGFHPRRDVKLALTCGEETEGAFNGAEDLVKNHRDLIDAEFALNEGGGGRLDEKGKRIALTIQAGEKVYQDFTLTVTSPGGHSSRPVRGENAILHLTAALDRIGAYEFPIEFNEVTRAYFAQMGKIEGGDIGAALIRISTDPDNPDALIRVMADPGFNGVLHTTCVPTMVKAGHATNALPQRAEANVNCRIFPTDAVAGVQAQLVKLADDPRVDVKPYGSIGERAPVPPLNDAIMGPVKRAAAKIFPGVPIVPAMTPGATDGRYLNEGGIPTYGLTGMFGDPDGGGVHGLNERIRVRSLYDGRDFLYAVIKDAASH
jgi:acetylornithine deacetylase/succinyl-diaminopimelate desuccinylase-like protein